MFIKHLTWPAGQNILKVKHSVAFLKSFCQKPFTADYTTVTPLLMTNSLQRRIKNPFIDSCLKPLNNGWTSLQWPLSSAAKGAVVERFNYLLGKDSLPHNLFILVTQHSAHCVTRQNRLRGRLRNTVIWQGISEILFTSGLVWTGTWLYKKGAFHSAKILFEISEIPCAKWIT